MPWKSGYTLSDETSPAAVVWPEGRAAFTLIVDCGVPAGEEGIRPEDIAACQALWADPMNTDWLLENLAHRHIKATFAVPAVIAEAFPQLAERIRKAGHEVAAGSLAKENVALLSEEEEGRRIQYTLDLLESQCGVRPSGWFSLPVSGVNAPGGCISPRTFDLLHAQGISYFGNVMADDIPHYCLTRANGSPMLCLPYYYGQDAQFFLFFPGVGKGSGIIRGQELSDSWQAELHGCIRYGRYASPVVQPYLLTSNILRKVLADMLDLVQELPFWKTDCASCAAYGLDRYPAATSFTFTEATENFLA